MKTMNTKKGFTLIELLIVIGILAVLAVLTVLVLNPAQLFAQARDSQRLADFRTLLSAISYVQSTATTTTFLASGSKCEQNVTSGMPTGPTGTSWTCAVLTTPYAVDQSGWVGVRFTDASGGSPVAKLPQNPSVGNGVNSSSTYFFKSDGTAYEMDTWLESQKYGPMMANDGGSGTNKDSYYEVGSSLSQ